MIKPVEVKIYALFHEVIYGGEYNLLAEEFRSKSDILQSEAQGFTPSQWKVMDAFSKVYHTMLTLALEKECERM